MKKIVCRLLMLMLLAGTLAVTDSKMMIAEAANTSGSYSQRIEQLKKKFPNGKYWNHQRGTANDPDGYTSTPCNHHGNCSKNGTDYSGWCGCNSFNNSAIQCMGFAEKLGYDLFGTNPRKSWTKSYDLSKVQAGDILRYNNHSIFVTKVSGNTLTYADCNSDGGCKIRWDATINKSEIRNFAYIQHANNYQNVMKIKSVALSSCKVTGVKSSYAYTGKAIIPEFQVKYGKSTLKKNRDYTVSIKNNVNTGKAVLTITGKGGFTGKLVKHFAVVPKKVVLHSVKKKGTEQIQLRWKKDGQASGYQILLSKNSKFKSGNKTFTVGNNQTTSKVIKGAKDGRTYYVAIRAYKLIDGKKCYGSYSSIKQIKL